MNPAVKRWLYAAELDLKAAGILLQDRSLSMLVGFHVQQGVRKLLMALSEHKNLKPVKSQDLLALSERVDDMIELNAGALSKLNRVYSDACCPYGSCAHPGEITDFKTAKEFYEYGFKVHQQVESVLCL
jgi:HEPN domain-containing protein